MSSNVQLHLSGSAADHDTTEPSPVRRSGNFKPKFWDYDYVQTLKGEYTNHMEELEKMKESVRSVINSPVQGEPLVRKLELIDAIQRLGLEYHFELEIKQVLGTYQDDDENDNDDLYVTALRFRLLRQHGYNVTQDVFISFMNTDSGKYKDSLCDDLKGILSLYEASFLRFENEPFLDEAMEFSASCLRNADRDAISSRLSRKIDHALHLPVHLTPCRVEARWFMEEYKKEIEMNPKILHLAKLDYNILQTGHKREAAELARWWVELGLSNLSFEFRDRVMEAYLWHNLMVFEPQYESFRRLATRISILILVIDDIYDVYGSLHELQLLTDIINRWTTEGLETLPPTIRTCYLAFYNAVNEFGDWAEKERGIHVIPYLHKVWSDQCKGYLSESTWYHKGIKPSFEEYLHNGEATIGTFMVLTCCFVSTSDRLTQDTLDYIVKEPSIIRCCGTISRLYNDLATSGDELARGDTLKAVELYMNESGSTEEDARAYIKSRVHETWKMMNKERLNEDAFSGPFIRACLNLARESQLFYQFGDGVGVPDKDTKKHMLSVLVEPVMMD